MRFLFFFVHPSKYHLFRRTINQLIDQGHDVEVLISSKDVLADLVARESWNTTNLFPGGRKSSRLPGLVNMIGQSVLTLYRLFKHTWSRRYDLMITDDLLVWVAKLKRVPSIAFCDDDIDVVRLFSVVLSGADHILAPSSTRLGRFESKKIPFEGYKELAYLHPEYFEPDVSVVTSLGLEPDGYILIRLVSLTAYHDSGKSGLSNEQVSDLIGLVGQYGRVVISAERTLPDKFEPYRLQTDPHDMSHLLYHASMFIGDSQTMTSEAGILGTPAVRCNDFTGRISVMDEKDAYGLTYSYPPRDFDRLLEQVQSLLRSPDLKQEHRRRRDKMLNEKIDVSRFLTALFGGYPDSIRIPADILAKSAWKGSRAST